MWAHEPHRAPADDLVCRGSRFRATYDGNTCRRAKPVGACVDKSLCLFVVTDTSACFDTESGANQSLFYQGDVLDSSALAVFHDTRRRLYDAGSVIHACWQCSYFFLICQDIALDDYLDEMVFRGLHYPANLIDDVVHLLIPKRAYVDNQVNLLGALGYCPLRLRDFDVGKVGPKRKANHRSNSHLAGGQFLHCLPDMAGINANCEKIVFLGLVAKLRDVGAGGHRVQ